MENRTELSYEESRIADIVHRAVNHSWSVPEFQRGFVWKTTQVRDLAESLWLDFPIGSLLLWSSEQQQEERIARDGANPNLWIVDGQQRTAALCIMFGRKPYWWESAESWNKTLQRYDIRFDVDATQPPRFVIANAAIRRAKGDRYIPLSNLLTLDIENNPGDQTKLEALARQIKAQDLCHGMDAMRVYTHLDSVRKARDRAIVTITVRHDLEDVVEIFSRLNSKGTRVTEADIYLGVVASKNPGWVRDDFLPYLKNLENEGFNVDPNLLFRTLTAIGIGSVRFRDIKEDFWQSNQIRPAWERCRTAWGKTISRLHYYGVLSDDPMPTKAALITLTALADKFPDEPFEPAMYWFLQASRFGRYSASATTVLDEDLRELRAAKSLRDAVLAMCRLIPISPMAADEFKRDYGDSRFGRFMLYLIAYRRKAQDWDLAGHRLGFEGGEVLEDFRPQWHHIFPRKFLEATFKDDEIDVLANIAVIGPAINIRISAQNPMNYLEKYKIGPEKLEQQLIPSDPAHLTIENYRSFVDERAQRLAHAANEYLNELRSGLPVDGEAIVPAAI
jgi:hypothetical protein